MSEAYGKLKVAELKELLKERGIEAKSGSKKQQLIEALEGHDQDVNVDDDALDESLTNDVKDGTSKSKKRAASPAPATDGPNKVAKKAESSTTSSTTNIKEQKKGKASRAQFASQPLIVPVDEHCPLASYHVYVDPSDGIIYDASLNQTNASNNNNKFYRVQLLEGPAGDFKTWTRWGRVGERGQSAVLGHGDFVDSLMQFEKKFRDKSGLAWRDRLEAPKAGKYVFVEKSYLPDTEDEEEDDEPQAAVGAQFEAPAVRARSWSPPKCSLEPPVRSLMELIFNETYFEAAMVAMKYDSEKLPLGKLSKTTITRGFQALKDISVLIETPYAIAEVEQLSNLYFSLIPHAFGRDRPPIIRYDEQIKKEAEMLDSLSDLKATDDIIKAGRKGEGAKNEMHPLDSRFNGLGLQEMSPLAPSSSEFNELSRYLVDTCGATHSFQYTVEDIFRIERQHELDRFTKHSKVAGVKSDRRLLWHGSRATNFGGILGQGLRIAPPEAPANGYMFDKGIYLADMSSKSANYCVPSISGGTALLLLCEAELGDPKLVLQDAMYHAATEAKEKGAISTWGQGSTGPQAWKDAGCVHPSLAGIQMPDTTIPPGSTGVKGMGSYGYASLAYNEYICYDIAQVRLRYLLRVRMR